MTPPKDLKLFAKPVSWSVSGTLWGRRILQAVAVFASEGTTPGGAGVAGARARMSTTGMNGAFVQHRCQDGNTARLCYRDDLATSPADALRFIRQAAMSHGEVQVMTGEGVGRAIRFR
jgi:hypothetical protein